jgi:kynurenine 3-monooxygenase
MVPFYGQGMNCAFEDVSVLDTLIDKHRFNWEAIFSEFEELRMPQAEAIQQMAEENFYEMRDATADPVFRRKRELETLLEQRYPDYFSKYSMVTFREDLPYTVARDLGNAQDRLLMEICRGVESISELDLEDVHRRLMSLASQQVGNA